MSNLHSAVVVPGKLVDGVRFFLKLKTRLATKSSHIKISKELRLFKTKFVKHLFDQNNSSAKAIR